MLKEKGREGREGKGREGGNPIAAIVPISLWFSLSFIPSFFILYRIRRKTKPVDDDDGVDVEALCGWEGREIKQTSLHSA